jgi:hypothetical protein
MGRQLFRHFQVEVEGVEGFVRVRQVPGVRQRDFSNLRCASIAGRIASMLLSASKIRKMSIPVFAASATNARATESG